MKQKKIQDAKNNAAALEKEKQQRIAEKKAEKQRKIQEAKDKAAALEREKQEAKGMSSVFYRYISCHVYIMHIICHDISCPTCHVYTYHMHICLTYIFATPFVQLVPRP